MEYCDYIADCAFNGLLVGLNSSDYLITDVSNVHLDLHPTEGWLQSTNKTIIVEDKNGLKYKVTVEALED